MVAARMTELAGEQISEAMLNACTAQSHEGHRFPLQWLPALIEATGCTEILAPIGEKLGAMILIGQAAIDARAAQIDREMERLRTEKRRILQIGGRNDA